MDTLFSVIIVIASALLVFVVFVQNPKGGGLSSDFGAAQQLGGVQKTNEFIDKTTWGLAIVVAVLSIVLTIRSTTTSFETPTEDPQTEAPAEGSGTPVSNTPG
tara:strand:- start:226 stop:534 length:309 start_codon:yes stop_codon:yes gene_type:complete